MLPSGHIDFAPDPKSQKEALASYKALSSQINPDSSLKIRIAGKKNEGSSIELSNNIARLLLALLEEISTGNPLSIIPLQTEMTTQQAADLLNFSRPFLVKLLENGSIPFYKVGKHRRINASDVLTYKEKLRNTSKNALNELVEDAQKLNMGYDVNK